MFAVLDTNHLREFVSASALGHRLRDRIREHSAEIFTCIVVIEESMQGWLSLLHRSEPGHDQVAIYEAMQSTLIGSMKLGVLPFDTDAATLFAGLRPMFRRRGTMDLKIAATCLVHDALLLTRNTSDFANVPGLHVENWLD